MAGLTPHIKDSKANKAVQRRHLIMQEETTFQPKLEVGPSDDQYEREADAVADQVVNSASADVVLRSPISTLHRKVEIIEVSEGELATMGSMALDESKIQRSPLPFWNSSEAIQTKCSACAQEEEKVQLKAIQRSGDGSMYTSNDFNKQLSSTKGGGMQMPGALQSELGGKMGADFSSVRIHTGSNAVQMNRDIGAKAFTHGSDIYFNEGNYNPHSRQGKHLLAHELTHTVQQNSGIKTKRIQRTKDDKKDPDSGIDYTEAKKRNREIWKAGLKRFNPFVGLHADPMSTPVRFAHLTKKFEEQLAESSGGAPKADGIFTDFTLYYFVKLATDENLKEWRDYYKSNKMDIADAIWRISWIMDKESGNEPLQSKTFREHWQYTYVNKTSRLVVKKDEVGDHVKALQDILIAMKYDIPESERGKKFNDATEKALKYYQADLGLTGKEIDGKVGPKTLRELDIRAAAIERMNGSKGFGNAALIYLSVTQADVDHPDPDAELIRALIQFFQIDEPRALSMVNDLGWHWSRWRPATKKDVAIGWKKVTTSIESYESIKKTTPAAYGGETREEFNQKITDAKFALPVDSKKLYELIREIEYLEGIEKARNDYSWVNYVTFFMPGVNLATAGATFTADLLTKHLPKLRKERDAELKRLGISEAAFTRDTANFKVLFGKFAAQVAFDMMRNNETHATIEQRRLEKDQKSTIAMQKICKELAPIYARANDAWWAGVAKELLLPSLSKQSLTDQLIAGLGFSIPGLKVATDVYRLYNITALAEQGTAINSHFQTYIDEQKKVHAILSANSTEFPLLASPKLELEDNAADYASMKVSEFQQVLLKHVKSVHGGIKSTKKRIENNYMLVWELPPVIQRAKAELGILEGTVHDAIINDEVKRIADAKFWRDIGLAALGIVLGLAALASGPVGWVALAGSITVGAIDAYNIYQDTAFKKDAYNTAIDPKNALSDTDPSWFWFALALVGIGLDLGIGKIATKVFSGIAKGVKGSKVFKLTKSAIEVEIEVARKAGNTQLVKELTESLKSLEAGKSAFIRQIDVLAEVKDHPLAVMRLATGMKASAAVEEAMVAITKLQKAFPSPGAYKSVFLFYGGVGAEFIENLPEVMHLAKAGDLVSNPKLLTEVLTDPKTQKVLLDNNHDPSFLAKQWKAYETANVGGTTLRFSKFLTQTLGDAATTLKKGEKISDLFGSAFYTWPLIKQNRTILRKMEPRFLNAVTDGTLPPKAQAAILEMMEKDLIGMTGDINRATSRMMKRFAPILGDSLEKSSDYRRIINLINDPAARKMVFESASSVKGYDEFTKILAEKSVKGLIENSPNSAKVMDDLVKLGPFTDKGTVEWLIRNKDIREALVQNPGALAALKKCASPCLPMFATADDILAVQAMVTKHGLSKAEYAKLNEYLYHFRNKTPEEFRAAIEELSQQKNIRTFLDSALGKLNAKTIDDIFDNYPWDKSGFKNPADLKYRIKLIINNSGMPPSLLHDIFHRAHAAGLDEKTFRTLLGTAASRAKTHGMKRFGTVMYGLASKNADEFDAALDLLKYINPSRGGFAGKADKVLEVFKLDDIIRFKNLAGEAFDLDAIHLLASRVSGTRNEIWALINKAGPNAADGVADPDIARLASVLDEMGTGPHPTSAIESALVKAKEFEAALRASGDKLGDVLWGFPKKGTGKRKLPKSFFGPDGKVSGAKVLAHFKGKADEIAKTVVRADGTIDWTQWKLIKAAIDDADIATILKNKAIGESLWPKIKIQQLKLLDSDVVKVVEEVSVRIKGTDVVARIDAVVVKADGTVIFKEFKTGNAQLSKAQEKVYELMKQGDPNKLLEPFGDKAKMVWDNPAADFKPRQVDVVRDKPPTTPPPTGNAPPTTDGQ